MENLSVPDLAGAARHLESACASLAEAVRALRHADGTAVLDELGQNFSLMAEKFQGGMLLAGLKVPVLGPKACGQILGASRSDKKLAALVRTRAKRADKRRDLAAAQTSGKRKSPGSMGQT
jgi:hypothetical protein